MNKKTENNAPSTTFKSPFLPENPKIVSVKEGYDLWSEIYDVETNVLIMLEERYLYPKLAQKNYSQIFDCGCGTGRLAHWLHRQFPKAKVSGADFSDGMLKKARDKDANSQINWHYADLNKEFPFTDKHFDLVVSSLVIEHINSLDNYFAEIRRVAVPGADIFITGLHPAMHLFGISARFKLGETKTDIMPESQCHDLATIFNAATAVGLRVTRIEEHLADAELTAQAPKAGRYLGIPLLFIMQMTPDPSGT
ncbi:MAG: class I SAM-dependent methyltransferase [Candidatus Riflebacteria bacterium]|nr:class I SAM-dependent methyltransferase [Candidatus Riflebacteria bacterium]